VRFVWFSRYLLLAFIVSYVVLLLIGLAGSGTAMGIGMFMPIGMGAAATLCVVAQIVVAIRRERGVH
jgi:hypothetical protein